MPPKTIATNSNSHQPQLGQRFQNASNQKKATEIFGSKTMGFSENNSCGGLGKAALREEPMQEKHSRKV